MDPVRNCLVVPGVDSQCVQNESTPLGNRDAFDIATRPPTTRRLQMRPRNNPKSCPLFDRSDTNTPTDKNDTGVVLEIPVQLLDSASRSRNQQHRVRNSNADLTIDPRLLGDVPQARAENVVHDSFDRVEVKPRRVESHLRLGPFFAQVARDAVQSSAQQPLVVLDKVPKPLGSHLGLHEQNAVLRQDISRAIELIAT